VKTAKRRVDAILDTLEEEIANTKNWRQAKVRPATDTTEFCSVPPSGLKRLEWWIRELRRANRDRCHVTGCTCEGQRH
jgi:hypothetical protein